MSIRKWQVRPILALLPHDAHIVCLQAFALHNQNRAVTPVDTREYPFPDIAAKQTDW